MGYVLAIALATALVAILRMRASLSRMSPHAKWLGRRVLVKKYEASDWEPATVVCVSHKGSLCIRRDYEEKGWWMDESRVDGRVMIDERGMTWNSR